MNNSSQAILGLKPVTFHYNTDKQNTPQFGLIAEEVAKVNPNLVVRNDNGEIYTVRYEAVNAMLLNEFLKEHRRVAEQQTKVAEQQSTIAELKTTVAQQQKQIESSHCDYSESERPSRSRQTCTTVGRQPLDSLVAYRIWSWPILKWSRPPEAGAGCTPAHEFHQSEGAFQQFASTNDIEFAKPYGLNKI
jgi:hypothetical protein